jgi:hypothetical protein
MALKSSENHAILVRIDWNENKWERPSADLTNAKNFGFVRENNISYTSFNFAHDIYETESDGLWYGLIPAFWSKTPDIDKIRNLKFVILISNYEKQDYIIGLYANPKIGNTNRKNKIPDFDEYDHINIGSTPSNIIRLENYVEINSLNLKRLLGDQEVSTMGWNYLNASNVGYILDEIEKINKENKKLNSLKLKYLKSIQ